MAPVRTTETLLGTLIMKSKLLAGVAGIAVALGVAGGAMAADLPVAVPVIDSPPITPIWTGFYVGAQVGYALVDSAITQAEVDAFTAFGYTADYDDDGNSIEAGIYAGADVQFDAFVLGVMADINYIDTETTLVVTDPAGPTVVADMAAGVSWYGGLRGRAGFAIDTFMPYVHGGLAYGNFDVSDTVAPAFDDSDLLIGYGVGAGVEALFMENVSVKAEYQFTDLGEAEFDIGGVVTTIDTPSFHSVRLGAALRF